MPLGQARPSGDSVAFAPKGALRRAMTSRLRSSALVIRVTVKGYSPIQLHRSIAAPRNRPQRPRMSNKTLSVNSALIKAKALAKKGAPGQAAQIYQAVLEKFPGNKRAIEGLRSLPKPRPGQAHPSASIRSTFTRRQGLAKPIY